MNKYCIIFVYNTIKLYCIDDSPHYIFMVLSVSIEFEEYKEEEEEEEMSKFKAFHVMESTSKTKLSHFLLSINSNYKF